MNSKQRTMMITKIALCVALISISAYISIPIPFTPVVVSAQTLVINLVAFILTPTQSFAALGVYLAIGFCGVPVFAGGGAGIGTLLGPTGGFLIGFWAAAVLISLLKGKEKQLWRYLVVSIGVGMPVIYFFGTLFLCLLHQMDIWSALMSAVVPFLVLDAAKCVVSSILGVALNKALARTGMAF